MANKRINTNRFRPSGADQHQNEIRSAKRAVSAALSDSVAAGAVIPVQPSAQAEQSVQSAPGVMRSLLRAAAGLIGAKASNISEDQPSVRTPSTLDSPRSPLTCLAKLHVANPSTSVVLDEAVIDRQCRRVLSNLADQRIQACMQRPAPSSLSPSNTLSVNSAYGQP